MTDGENLVVDASAIAALLIAGGERGEWVAKQVLGKRLFAPEMLYYETANILRRESRKGTIDETTASVGYRDLLAMKIYCEPFSVLANRVWELRGSVTAYDASYIAVAEWRQAPLLTADLRLTRSNGPRCRFLTPPGP
ncbi:type II toxin-antitoxin system VapC family toxin [Glycomyces sp. A-F 0318]|uniref:type II toxin-antitoxin system VapC family toxin n=1 Tax=Glycomyces amatae TaxID=2881355 RepID=UPI001E421F54|nr:type II toxin-antitoxin system VapC family toxin [Glycomyces amatae]MCD0442465.1 type II toxin-antitoxin system VapC family toxin [Glycomyces amatae]